MMTAKVAIATCKGVLNEDYDDLQVIAALQRRGIIAVHAVWDDPTVDWSVFSLVVVRSTWDYSDRCGEFLEWAERLPKVLNPLPILRWNTNKRYLDDLARHAIPVVPTRFLEPGDAFALPPGPFVVKPSISCSAKDTARYSVDEAKSAREHVRQLQSAGRTVMIQPYLSGIEATGEISLMYIDGTYSHAICRDPSLKHSGLPYEDEVIPLSVDVYENIRKHEPTTGELALAERVMSYVLQREPNLLYARVDLIPDANGEPIILEIELTEPTLFLAKFSQDGVERLADGIARALDRA
jgi:glutathione synthase/RimK-type ligase-like ATP-grasp enzyme